MLNVLKHVIVHAKPADSLLASHFHDDLAGGVPFDALRPRLPRPAQREPGVDHRLELPLPRHLRQPLHLLLLGDQHQRHQPLLGERHLLQERPGGGGDPRRDVDDGGLLRQHRRERRPRRARRAVDHRVVPGAGGAPHRGALGGLVVEHLVGAQASDEAQVARAAGGRHVEPRQLRQLHGVVAHAAGGRRDQHVLGAAGGVAGAAVEAADPGRLQLLQRGGRRRRQGCAFGGGHLRRPCHRERSRRHRVLREPAASLPLR
ncbi:unnamed protein product [Urochloa decumbens]|uniref:Uncharacterized protein n=1 Tax=Urochloa decumbens TaxID=240449 RepID=A0ABC9FTW7_9POAL